MRQRREIAAPAVQRPHEKRIADDRVETAGLDESQQIILFFQPDVSFAHEFPVHAEPGSRGNSFEAAALLQLFPQRIGQDLLGPSSQVFGFPPLLAVVIPAGICALAGVWLLRRAG